MTMTFKIQFFSVYFPNIALILQTKPGFTVISAFDISRGHCTFDIFTISIGHKRIFDVLTYSAYIFHIPLIEIAYKEQNQKQSFVDQHKVDLGV